MPGCLSGSPPFVRDSSNHFPWNPAGWIFSRACLGDRDSRYVMTPRAAAEMDNLRPGANTLAREVAETGVLY